MSEPSHPLAPPGLVQPLLGLAVLTGGVVLMEPAPYDLLMCGALVVGPMFLWPSFRPSLALPLLLAALLVLANGISIVLSPDLGRSLGFFGVTAYLLASAALVAGWLDRAGTPLLRTLLHAYAVGAGITATLAVGAYFGVLPGAELMLPKGRLQGLFKDANVFGAFMVPAVVLAVARLGDARRRAPWAVLLLVGGLGVLLSYSRGAWINLALSVIAYLGLRLASGRVRPSLATIVGACVGLMVLGGALVAALEHPTVREMLEIRASAQGYDDDRFGNQAAALVVALEHPLGIGPGATEVRFPISAHSLYVRAFVENGVLGLWATLGLLLLSQARALWVSLQPGDEANQRMLTVVAAALVGAVVESAVIDTIHWRHLWLLLALAWAPRLRER
ncbi:MAG: O-antigen ligase family protein [Myxococcales bacterium]|nr:O-antigen ligase family protein [Myxococcales bacterium]MCB9715202.1 O-antigen ligase family protein [Myxococcales bacterium]